MQDETQRLEQPATPRPEAAGSSAGGPPRPGETSTSSGAPPPPASGEPAAAPAASPTGAPQPPLSPPVDQRPSPRGPDNLRTAPGPVAPPAPPEPVVSPTLPVYTPEHVEPMYLPLALSVGAGFKFGCGFMLAMGMAAFALFLAFSVVFFIASLMGIPLPIGAAP